MTKFAVLVVAAACGWAGAAQSSSAGTSSADEKPGQAAQHGAIQALRAWLEQSAEKRPAMAEQGFAAAALSRAEAEEAARLLWEDHAAQVRATRRAEWTGKSITIGDRTMRFETRAFGEKPAAGRSLFISMHGGGNTAKRVNDSQWRNQVDLYKPAEGLYIAPRAPTDAWNLWHEAPMDGLLDRLIEDAVVFGEVNPDRVYLMGYSAGGDGVYQLAPRMADRWAAAAMMAGHPNDASPLNLRNTPLAIHVGELDGGFGRNEIARKWGAQLDKLREGDPQGYEHVVELHAGRGHWMNLEDASAVPWMASHTRTAAPKRVVWRRTGAGTRLYWLAAPATTPGGAVVVASVQGQTVTIERAEGFAELEILLDDRLVDLDKPVTVRLGERTLWEGRAARTIAGLARSLGERADPRAMFPARVAVELTPPS